MLQKPRGFADGAHKGSLQDFSGPPAATDDVLTLTGLTTLLQQSPAYCAALCNTNVGVTAEIKYLRKFWFPSSGQNSLVKLDYRNDHV